MEWKRRIVLQPLAISTGAGCYVLMITSNLLLRFFPFFYIRDMRHNFKSSLLTPHFPMSRKRSISDFVSDTRPRHAIPQNRIAYISSCKGPRGDLHTYITHRICHTQKKINSVRS
jgi:hypothetical protein